MAERKHSDRARRKAEEQVTGDPPEAANSGRTDHVDFPEDVQEPRRVPGLYGYDPSQWPDTGR